MQYCSMKRIYYENLDNIVCAISLDKVSKKTYRKLNDNVKDTFHMLKITRYIKIEYKIHQESFS